MGCTATAFRCWTVRDLYNAQCQRANTRFLARSDTTGRPPRKHPSGSHRLTHVEKRLSGGVLLALYLLACAPPSGYLQEQKQSSDDSAVLSSVIDMLGVVYDDRRYLVVAAEARLQFIDKDWVIGHFSAKRGQDSRPPWDELISDFKLRNSRDHALLPGE
jgi:hypothetical protein